MIALLQEEWTAIGELGSLLGGHEWDMPSKCPGWRVKDVLSHPVGTELSLSGELSPLAVDPLPPHVRNPMGASNEAWLRMLRVKSGPEVLASFAGVTGADWQV